MQLLALVLCLLFLACISATIKNLYWDYYKYWNYVKLSKNKSNSTSTTERYLEFARPLKPAFKKYIINFYGGSTFVMLSLLIIVIL